MFNAEAQRRRGITLPEETIALKYLKTHLNINIPSCRNSPSIQPENETGQKAVLPLASSVISLSLEYSYAIIYNKNYTQKASMRYFFI